MLIWNHTATVISVGLRSWGRSVQVQVQTRPGQPARLPWWCLLPGKLVPATTQLWLWATKYMWLGLVLPAGSSLTSTPRQTNSKAACIVLYCDEIKSPTVDMYILAIYILFNDHESCQADDLVLKSCYYHPSGRSQPHCSSAAPAPLSPSSSPRCRSQAACPSGGAGAAGAQRPPGTDFPHSAIILPFRSGSMELIQG